MKHEVDNKSNYVEILPKTVFGLTRQELDKIRNYLIYGNIVFSFFYVITILYASLRLFHVYLTKLTHSIDTFILALLLMGYFSRILCFLSVKIARLYILATCLFLLIVSFILDSLFVFEIVVVGK